MKSANLESLNTNTLALVPVKSLVFAKSRLATILTAAERITLALNLLHNTLATLLTVFSNVAVITADVMVTELAINLGAGVLPEEFQATPANANLNKSLRQALQNLELSSVIKYVLIVPADLPFLSPIDLEEVNSIETSPLLNINPTCVIVPDKQQEGTNALLLPVGYIKDFEFRFGENSFVQHLDEFSKLSLNYQICRPAGLIFDLDTPADFAAVPTNMQNALLSNPANHLYTKISTFCS